MSRSVWLRLYIWLNLYLTVCQHIHLSFNLPYCTGAPSCLSDCLYVDPTCLTDSPATFPSMWADKSFVQKLPHHLIPFLSFPKCKIRNKSKSLFTSKLCRISCVSNSVSFSCLDWLDSQVTWTSFTVFNTSWTTCWSLLNEVSVRQQQYDNDLSDD